MEGKLISEVSKYRNLYDQSLDSYKDNELKNKIWGKIAGKILGDSDIESIEKIKSRWKSLRDSFLRNLKKTGVQGNKKIRPWKYSEQMQFLLPYIGGKWILPIKEETPYDDSPGELTQNGDISQDFGEGYTESDEYKHNGDDKHRNYNNKRSLVFDKNVKKFKHDRSRSISISQDYLQALLLNCEKDPIDSFFLGIAQTVKKLTPVNQAFIKKAVANLVIDTEINELEESNNLGWEAQGNSLADFPSSIYEPAVDLTVPSDNIHHSSSSTSVSSMCSAASDP